MLALVLLVLAVEGTKEGPEQGDGNLMAGGDERVETPGANSRNVPDNSAAMTSGGERVETPGPTDEGSCACDIDITGGGAYVELLKRGDEYQSMDQEQRDAYVAMAIDFITPKNAYECARNALLVESAEIALQMGSANDSRCAGELAAEYGVVMQKLEEYGVGPQDETGADPSRYFEKYDRAVERLGGLDGCGEAGAQVTEAGPDGTAGQG